MDSGGIFRLVDFSIDRLIGDSAARPEVVGWEDFSIGRFFEKGGKFRHESGKCDIILGE